MGTAVAMLSVTTAVRYLPTVVSTVGLLGVPVFALTLSVLFLGEQLTVDLVTGVVLILAGIGLVSVPDRKPAAP
jgi:drug/metabolite transporter (DMT)-like permease